MSVVPPFAAGVTENKAKESLSGAFLRALAAQAGLNIRTGSEYDDGFDLDVGSGRHRPFQDIPCAPATWITFQLKARTNCRVVNGALSCQLKKEDYDLLRDECTTRAYLLLYILPSDRDEWVTSCSRNGSNEICDHYCELSYSGFYLDLRGRGPVPNGPDGNSQSTITVHVPLANRLTKASLLELYRASIEQYIGGSSGCQDL